MGSKDQQLLAGQPEALAGEDGKRSAQDLADEAPIETGTAGRKTPAQESMEHRPPTSVLSGAMAPSKIFLN